MASLTAMLPPAEQTRVRRTAELVQAEAVPAVPDAARDSAGRICFVVTAIAPDLPRPELALLVRYAMWSIMLDDDLDARPVRPADLHRVRDLVTGSLAGVPGPRPEPLARMLDGILSDLATRDRTGATRARLATALQDATGSGIAHALLADAVARGVAPAPSAEGYLVAAARTVNYRSFAYALLIANGAAMDAAGLDRLDPALWHAAYAVRLSNDLASAARDRTTQTLNVLNLHTHDGRPVRPDQVRQQVARHVRAHHGLLAPWRHHPELAGPAQALTRCLRLSVDLYLHSDLR